MKLSNLLLALPVTSAAAAYNKVPESCQKVLSPSKPLTAMGASFAYKCATGNNPIVPLPRPVTCLMALGTPIVRDTVTCFRETKPVKSEFKLTRFVKNLSPKKPPAQNPPKSKTRKALNKFA